MADAANTSPNYEARPVSRFHIFDWNYAYRVAQIPALTPASFIIASMPLLSRMTFLSGYIANLWVLWAASICFLSAILFLKIRMPRFIKEYRYYTQYQSRGHSHRWIVWEFFNNLSTLSDPNYIVLETKAKGIILPCDDSDLNVCRVCPIFRPNTQLPVEVSKPIQVDRDIYLPIRAEGHRMVLAMQESDPALDLKQKELFWILLTQFAKERPISRSIVWLLFTIAGLLYCSAIVNNVMRVAAGTSLFSMLHAAEIFITRGPAFTPDCATCFGVGGT